MAYNQFSLSDLKTKFGLTTQEKRSSLFGHVAGVTPNPALTNTLQTYSPLATAINTEKARSEMIVAPILMEFWRLMADHLSLFSGTDFPVDTEQGLVGTVDFMVCASPERFFITAPAVIIVEAKRESLKTGLGQCGATMLAAQLFNTQHNYPIDTIYGAVTTGTAWQFLKLEETTLHIDWDEYYANQIDKILGILMSTVAPLGITP